VRKTRALLPELLDTPGGTMFGFHGWRHSSLFRRRLLVVLCIAAGVSVVITAVAIANTSRSVLTRFTVQGVWVKGDTSLAGIWLADKRGYFARQGIDLSVRPGGTLDPIQIVLAGSTNAGIQALPALLAARAKGAPVKIFRL